MDPVPGRKHIRVFYGRPGRFRDSFREVGACGGLFLSTEEPFEAGEFILLEVHMRGAPNAVWLDATVVKVRHAAAGPDDPVGVTLEFGAHNEERLEFLRRLAWGEDTGEPKRRRMRTPVLLGAELRGEKRITSGWVRDISHGGLCVSARRLPSGSQWEIVIRSPYDERRITVPVEIRWRSEDGTLAGASFGAAPPEQRVALAALVSRLEANLQPVTILA